MNESLLIDNLLDEEALSINQRKEMWRENRARLLPVVQAMKKLDARITFPNSIDIGLSGDKHTLTAAVRALRTHGFKSADPGPPKGANSWCTYFRADACPIAVWFSFSSTVCRRVKVGTTMVEQEVYETVCDELVLDGVTPSDNAEEAAA